MAGPPDTGRTAPHAAAGARRRTGRAPTAASPPRRRRAQTGRGGIVQAALPETALAWSARKSDAFDGERPAIGGPAPRIGADTDRYLRA